MERAAAPNPGLCQTCQHARRIRSARGSVFWHCGAHKQNPAMQKYPSLPVLRCPAYAPSEPQTPEDE
jgi:hypothetical protein